VRIGAVDLPSRSSTDFADFTARLKPQPKCFSPRSGRTHKAWGERGSASVTPGTEPIAIEPVKRAAVDHKGWRPFYGLDFLHRLPGVPLADSLHPRLYASAHFAGWESFDLRHASGKSCQENKKLLVCFTDSHSATNRCESSIGPQCSDLRVRCSVSVGLQ
jgi:hypothetical protein